MMQSGIFLMRYQTEMTDAGMPMLVLVLRMPMPSYAGILFTHFKPMCPKQLNLYNCYKYVEKRVPIL
jgi:hypothetical protein